MSTRDVREIEGDEYERAEEVIEIYRHFVGQLAEIFAADTLGDARARAGMLTVAYFVRQLADGMYELKQQMELDSLHEWRKGH